MLAIFTCYLLMTGSQAKGFNCPARSVVALVQSVLEGRDSVIFNDVGRQHVPFCYYSVTEVFADCHCHTRSLFVLMALGVVVGIIQLEKTA